LADFAVAGVEDDMAGVGVDADQTGDLAVDPAFLFGLAGGVPISEVSRWLCHKSITTTVDLYGHLVPEASGRAPRRAGQGFPARPTEPVSFRCALNVPWQLWRHMAPQVKAMGGGRVGL
jgi:hypothetical protein